MTNTAICLAAGAVLYLVCRLARFHRTGALARYAAAHKGRIGILLAGLAATGAVLIGVPLAALVELLLVAKAIG